jgi:hypothetical protein
MSSKTPYAKKQAQVLGRFMTYIEIGQSDPRWVSPWYNANFAEAGRTKPKSRCRACTLSRKTPRVKLARPSPTACNS